MQIIRNLDSFFRSSGFVNFYQKFSVIGFWISLPVCLFMVFLIFRIEKKYKTRKNEIKEIINAPGMEDVKKLFKSKLEEHGIDYDDKKHEQN